MANPPLLPSARIRCNATGWIKVGDKNYLSASDALTAYMQQFDGSQVRSCAGKSNSTSVLPRSSTVDVLAQTQRYGLGGSAVPPSRSNPANITGLLISSHGDMTSGLNGLSSAFPSHMLSSSGLQSSRNSVSISAPDSQSRLCASGSALDPCNSVNSPGLSQSASAHRPTHNSSVNSLGTTQQAFNANHSLGLSHLKSTSASLPPHTSAAYGGHFVNSSSNGFLENGYSNGSSHNGQGPRATDGHSNPVYSAGSRRAKSEVEVLLTTSAATRREIRTMSEDALREAKLNRLLREAGQRSLQKALMEDEEGSHKMPKQASGESSQSQSSGNSTKSCLQQEVEEALTRSGQLLETIKTESLASPGCISDVGSFNTEALLTVDPYSSGRGGERESRSRHRYSYHTPGHHNRSVSLGRATSTLEQQRFIPQQQGGRRRSVDSLRRSAPLSLQGESKLYHSSSASVSVASDSFDISRQKSYNSPSQRPKGGPPSWIQELIPPAYANSNVASHSGVADSVFSERDESGGRKTPSWIHGIEQSEIASSIDTQALQDTADNLTMFGSRKVHQTKNTADDSAVTDVSCSGPGLNYSDLVTTPTKHKVSFSDLPPHPARGSRLPRNNSFSGIGNGSIVRSGLRKDMDRSKPPVIMSSRYFLDLAGVEVTRHQSQDMPTNLSTSVGSESPASLLRQKVSHDSAQARLKMDSFLTELSTGEGRQAGIPRCSSVERLDGLGHSLDVPSDITGASTIAKDSNFSSKLCLDDPTLTPALDSKASTRYTWQTREDEDVNCPDDLLDGDRSWEKAAPSL